MMRRSITVLAMLAAAFAGTPATAQDTSAVAPGDRVKVLAPLLGRYEWKAEFVAMRGDSIVLRGRGGDSALTVLPIAKISRFDVNHGNRPAKSRALEGLIEGTLAGLGVGLVLASGYTCTYECGTLKQEITLVSTATLGALGLGVGALIRTEPYERVWLKPQAAVVSLPGGRVGFGLQVRL